MSRFGDSRGYRTQPWQSTDDTYFNSTYFSQNVGRNESCELRHPPTFTVIPLPELAALGPAYGAWPHG